MLRDAERPGGRAGARGPRGARQRGAREPGGIGIRAIGVLGTGFLLLPQTGLNYPPTRREVERHEVLGLTVEDPYRWLEDAAAPEVRAWCSAQGELSAGLLDGRAALEEELRALLAEGGTVSLPRRGGARLFYVRTGAESVLCVLPDGGTERVLLELGAAGPAGPRGALPADVRPAPDGAHVALALPADDPQHLAWRVLDVEAGALLAPAVPIGPAAGGPGALAWLPDGESFLAVVGGDQGGARVVEHLIDGRLEDAELLRVPDLAAHELGLGLSAEGRYALASLPRGGAAGGRFLVRDRDEPRDGFRVLFEDPGAATALVHADAGLVWLRTELGAPRGRIVLADLVRPEPDAWGELVPQRDEVLLGGSGGRGAVAPRFAGGRFVLPYRSGALVRLELVGEDGETQGELELPAGLWITDGEGPWGALSATPEAPELFVRMAGALEPCVVQRFDLATGERSAFLRPRLGFDPAAFEREVVHVAAPGGREIAVTLTRRRDLERGDPRPTWLVPSRAAGPDPHVHHLPFLAAGGVLAVAELIPGPWGEPLRDAEGARLVLAAVDELCAVAEWLVAAERTSPARLAAGGSGPEGCLVAAALARRPELFGAVLVDHAPLDLLAAGGGEQRGSAGEGAEPAPPEPPGGPQVTLEPGDLAALLSASPYHALQDGAHLPAVLVTTSEGHPRAGQALRYAAALQHAQGGQAPVVLHVAPPGPPAEAAARGAATWAAQHAFVRRVLE